jgi:hypothetical protein
LLSLWPLLLLPPLPGYLTQHPHIHPHIYPLQLAITMEDPFGTETFDLPIETIERGVDKDLCNLSNIVGGIKLADLAAGRSIEGGEPARAILRNGASTISPNQQLLPNASSGEHSDFEKSV